jgi:hypothetical protein
MAIKTGFAPTSEGKTGTQPISISDRTRMAETLMSFVYPRLASTQVVGPGDGPLQIATINVVDLMSDPLTAAAAQKVALSISTAQREGLRPRQLESGEDQ